MPPGLSPSTKGSPANKLKRKYKMQNNTEIVPFGKYKDQPVEIMLADQNYLEWITLEQIHQLSPCQPCNHNSPHLMQAT
jgi:hypothetical protein